MNEGPDGHVPSSVRDHNQAKERPYTEVVEARHQRGQHADCAEYISPCALINFIVDQIDVAEALRPFTTQNQHRKYVDHIGASI